MVNITKNSVFLDFNTYMYSKKMSCVLFSVRMDCPSDPTQFNKIKGLWQVLWKWPSLSESEKGN